MKPNIHSNMESKQGFRYNGFQLNISRLYPFEIFVVEFVFILRSSFS